MHASWLLLLAFCKAASASPEVKLGSTTVLGRTLKGTPDLEFFGGIPYAEAPISDLRFSPPVLKTTLDVSTMNASQYRASCLQFLNFDPPLISGTGSESEDCLFVNIVRPAGLPKNAELPVMFWIYGGGFSAGSSTQFDPSDLVRRSVSRGTPIVFVSCNYRLGPLGYPQGSEATARGALNLGQKDTWAALEWVQANVGVFGGDKTKVTAFGESAGAFTIGIHYLNPHLDTVIRAGIMQSGAAPLTLPLEPSQADKQWSQLVASFPECSHAKPNNTLGCLRQVNADTLQKAAASEAGSTVKSTWWPVIDGPDGVFPDKPTSLYQQGHIARVPFLSGSNKDEGTLFTDSTINSTAGLANLILSNFNVQSRSPHDQQAFVDEVLKLYPDDVTKGSPYDTGDETFGLSPEWKRGAAIEGDVLMQAQRRALMHALSNNGVKGYGYLFAEHYAPLDPSWGVPHAVDQPYIFPELQLYGFVWDKNQSQIRLQENIMDYWISFADSLDPNDKHGNIDRPTWPTYQTTDPTILQLDSSNMTVIRDDYRKEAFEYLIYQASV